MEKEVAAINPQAAAPAGVCPNCGTELAGEYCYACGQRRIHHHLSLRGVIGDAVSHAADFAELKTVHTATTLLTKPGRLTNDYIAGRRAAWITPLKLYLTIFALTFFLYSAFKSVAIYDLGTLAETDRTGALARTISEVSARKHIAPDAFVANVNARWHSYATFSQIIYPLLFAAVLKLFYWRRRFIEHLIFSLHYQAMVFLITILAWPLYFVTGIAMSNRSAVLAIGVMVILIAYLLLALRAVYRQSWPVSSIKSVVLYGAYFVIYTAVTYGTLFAAMIVTARH